VGSSLKFNDLEILLAKSLVGKFNSVRRILDDFPDPQIILNSFLLARDQLQFNTVSIHAVYRVIDDIQPVV
jgi:hypothetical protein